MQTLGLFRELQIFARSPQASLDGLIEKAVGADRTIVSKAKLLI